MKTPPAEELLSQRERDYFQKHRHVEKGILSDPRTKLAFARGKNLALRPYMGTPNQIHPEMLSTNPLMVDYLKSLADTLNSDLEAEPDGRGYTRNGVPGDFNALRTLSGLKMERANAPISDADELVKQKGLATRFLTARHRQIAQSLFDCMFGSPKRSSARLSAVSSSTVPHHTSEITDKQAILRRALTNLPDLLDKYWKDPMEAFLQYGAVVMNTLVERHQPDAWVLQDKVMMPKPRKVITPDAALAGRVEEATASKTSVIEELYGYEGVAAMRVRTAYASAGTMTYLFTCLMAQFRAHYLERYAHTWHHRGAEDTFRKLEGAPWSVGIDVTQMDQHVPSFFMDFYVENMKRIVHPDLAHIFHHFNHAPYFAPQLAPGEEPFWNGDPFWGNRDEGPYVGLASGRPDNPDLGKFWMTYVYLVVIDDLCSDVLEQSSTYTDSIDVVLRGHHPDLNLLAMGDDAVLAGRPGTHINKDTVMEYLRADSSSKYALLDVEEVLAFLGAVGRSDSQGNLVAMEPNPVTAVVNWFNAEHGLDSRHRQYWGHGLLARLEHYSGSAAAMDAWHIAMDLWQHKMPDVPNPEAAAREHRQNVKMPFVSSLSDIDIEVMLDRTKLYYKYTPDDVSSEIADMFTSKIDGDLIARHLNPYLRRSI